MLNLRAVAPHTLFRANDDTFENREANKRDGEEYLRAVMKEAGAARVVERIRRRARLCAAHLRRLASLDQNSRQWEMRDGVIIPGRLRAVIHCDVRDTRSPADSRFMG
jgi:hypothetical protein